MYGFVAFVLTFVLLPTLFLISEDRELRRRLDEDRELYEQQKRSIEDQRNKK